MKLLNRTWAEIDLDAIDINLEAIRSATPGKEVIGVVKADAYGHCAKIVCKELYSKGVRFYAVSNAWEGIEVRELLGNDVKIIVFGYIYEEFYDEMLEYGLIATVGSVEFAKSLNEYGKKRNVKIPVHIELDTGMSRVGIRTEEEISEVFAMANLDVCGGYTHFPSADLRDEDSIDFTRKQERRLTDMLGKYDIPLHSQNSGGTVFYQDFPGTYSRAGLILYGLAPNTSVETPVKLKQAMTLKSTINQLKLIPKGTTIGYGRTYTADCDQLIAVIPTGYADGYSRRLSNKGKIAVNGVLCPIRGRVCMDQLMIDVSDVPDVKVGDVALLYSDIFKETSLDYIADSIGTITNEVICAVSARVPRVAVRNGETLEIVRYR